MPATSVIKAKSCHKCQAEFLWTGIHCIDPHHDPQQGWIWCSKECRLEDHRKDPRYIRYMAARSR